MRQFPSFAVISGEQVHRVISGREVQITRKIEAAYRLHGEGATVNPDSYFLRFPDQPSARIIALPASIKGDIGVHGVKWISSFPENIVAGIPRASGVLILNDTETGYPFACLEGSIISAARTAASAALAAVQLSERRAVRPTRIGFTGCGLIARHIHTYLIGNKIGGDETTPPPDQPVIFSPFGLGVLDLTLARYVYDQVVNSGELRTVPDFFPELNRYGE